jgi:arginine exporter protein ArgO
METVLYVYLTGVLLGIAVVIAIFVIEFIVLKKSTFKNDKIHWMVLISLIVFNYITITMMVVGLLFEKEIEEWVNKRKNKKGIEC